MIKKKQIGVLGDLVPCQAVTPLVICQKKCAGFVFSNFNRAP